MSSTSIRKEISARLLKSVERAENKLVSEASREVFQSAEVSQCLVLDRKGITALTKGFEAGLGRPLSPYERTEYRKGVKEHFIGMQKPFPDIPEKKFFVRILSQNNLKLGANIFYLGTSFRTIKDKYHAYNKDFMETKASMRGKNYSREAASTQTEFDHGAQSTAVAALGGGAAAVSVALDRGVDFGTLKEVAGNNLAALIDSRMTELSKGQKAKIYNRLFDIIIDWKQIVSEKGSVKAGAGIVVSARSREENNARASLEKKEFNILLDAIDAVAQDIDWTEVQGSSNLREKMQKRAVTSLTDGLTKIRALDVKVTLDPKISKAKTKTKNKVRESSKSSPGKKATPYKKSRGAAAGALLATKGAPRRKRSNVNVTAILGVLNDQLPRVVAKNMGSPALNFRTGRFSSSVRAIDIAITAKGHPSIGYTYQRDPYEVFEASSGSRFSSTDRDPRKLIDFSIREIAASQAITRLYTRRI